MKTTCFIRTSRLLLGLICTITFCTCFCQETKKPQIQKGSKEQEILDLEIRRLNAFATADTNAFKNMVTEDLIIVHGSGTMMNRAQEISVMRPSTLERPLPKLSIESARVNFYDNTAIMRGNLVETASDGRRELVLRFTNTYVNQNKQWRLAASQLNTLSRERAVKQVDSLIFKAYTGEYQTPSGKVISVVSDGGKLFIKNGGSGFELFPRSENQFFIKQEDSFFVFIKDNNGEVVTMVNRQPNGDIIEIKRVK